MKRLPFENVDTEASNQMNVVPMIDVLLVLLVIFMVCSPTLVSNINIELPKTHKNPPSNNSPTMVIVSIDVENKLYLSDMAAGYVDKQKTPVELYKNLKIIKRAKPDQKIFVKAHKHVKYDQIVHVLELINNSGFETVNLATRVGS